MKTQFSVKETDLRSYSNLDLINIINSDIEDNNLTYTDIIESLTPKKRLLAYAILELYKRKDDNDKIMISSSKDVYNAFKSVLSDLEHEEFWVIYLNRGNRIIKRIKMSSGGISETAVDIRLILKNDLSLTASAVILAHNHPSGNIRPSSNDDMFTDRFKEASELLSINLLDHVSTGENAYFSYADEGKI